MRHSGQSPKGQHIGVELSRTVHMQKRSVPQALQV